MAIALLKSRCLAALAVLAAMVVFVATAKAQNQPNQVVNPGETLPSYQTEKPITPDRAPTLNNDADVARWLQIENNGEVRMAKLAEARAQNSSVKHFAEHMIHDHSQFLGKLQPFEMTAVNMAPPAGNNVGTAATVNARPEGPVDAGRATIAGTPNTPAAPGTAGTPIRAPDVGSVPTVGSVPNSAPIPTPGGLSVPGTIPAPAARTTIASPPQPPITAQPERQVAHVGIPATADNANRTGFDFLEVRRQIGDQSLADATKQWDMMSPFEADKNYVGMQIAAHQNYIETSMVLRRHASPQLRDLIDDGIHAAQAHLDEAKEIMRELAETAASPTTSNIPTSGTPQSQENRR